MGFITRQLFLKTKKGLVIKKNFNNNKPLM